MCIRDRSPTAYFLGKVSVVRNLEANIPEECLVTQLAYHYDGEISKSTLSGRIKTIQDMAALLEEHEQERHYLQTRQRNSPNNRNNDFRSHQNGPNGHNPQVNNNNNNHNNYHNSKANNNNYYQRPSNPNYNNNNNNRGNNNNNNNGNYYRPNNQYNNNGQNQTYRRRVNYVSTENRNDGRQYYRGRRSRSGEDDRRNRDRVTFNNDPVEILDATDSNQSNRPDDHTEGTSQHLNEQWQ